MNNVDHVTEVNNRIFFFIILHKCPATFRLEKIFPVHVCVIDTWFLFKTKLRNYGFNIGVNRKRICARDPSSLTLCGILYILSVMHLCS